MQIISRSVEETLRLGQNIGRRARPGQVLALVGTLGAGKTHLVRGIALGASVADPDIVSSPTYVLLNIYPGDPAAKEGKPVYHLDAYRISGAAGFAAVGFEELLSEEGIIAVEWADRIPELLPTDHLRISIEVQDESTRVLTLTPFGPESCSLLEQLKD